MFPSHAKSTTLFYIYFFSFFFSHSFQFCFLLSLYFSSTNMFYVTYTSSNCNKVCVIFACKHFCITNEYLHIYDQLDDFAVQIRDYRLSPILLVFIYFFQTFFNSLLFFLYTCNNVMQYFFFYFCFFLNKFHIFD